MNRAACRAFHDMHTALLLGHRMLVAASKIPSNFLLAAADRLQLARQHVASKRPPGGVGLGVGMPCTAARYSFQNS